MKKRRYSFTLVELLISLSLSTLLISSLFFWYRHLGNTKKILAEEKRVVIEERYLLQRLQMLLNKAKLPFSSNGNTLTFHFNRGVFEQPELAGEVEATIALNGDLLLLTVSSLKEPGLSQQFPLVDRVSHLEFEFYSPPDSAGNIVDPEKVKQPRPNMGIQSQWEEAYEQLPALVKLTLERNGRRIDLHFDGAQPIIFPKEST